MEQRLPPIIAQDQQNENNNRANVKALAPRLYNRLLTRGNIWARGNRRHIDIVVAFECGR
jgi:hypothetical protein